MGLTNNMENHWPHTLSKTLFGVVIGGGSLFKALAALIVDRLLSLHMLCVSVNLSHTQR